MCLNGDPATGTKLILKFNFTQLRYLAIVRRLIKVGEMQCARDLVKDDVSLQKKLVKLLVDQ